MPSSLYNVLKKSAPFCLEHNQQQALFYNVQQQQFLCQQCVNINVNNNNLNDAQYTTKIYPLQLIVQNPVLLMLKQPSFLSKIDSSTTKQYKVQQFIKILTDIDLFIKTKKSTHQSNKQFLIHIKQQINNKIDNIIKRLEQNVQQIQQLEKKTRQLKNIKKDYSNQFLQTLQSNFVNGSQEELRELLRRYSVENENPFRKIDEIIEEISQRVNGFVEVNWQHVMEIEKKVLDPYMWRQDMIYLMKNNRNRNIQKIQRQYTQQQQQKQRQLYSNKLMMSLKQERMILPYSAPCRLGFMRMNQQHLEQKDRIYSKHQQSLSTIQSHEQQQEPVYIQCTNNTIQLLTINNNNHQQQRQHQQQHSSSSHSQSLQQQQQFIKLSKYRCQYNNSIDMLYQLPYRMLLSVSYQQLTFYSYQFNQIKLITQINTIKSTKQVLVFKQYCLVLTMNNTLHLINYHILNKPITIGWRVNNKNNNNYYKDDGNQYNDDDDTIEQISYLYQNRRKLDNYCLLNVYNQSTQSYRLVKLKIC